MDDPNKRLTLVDMLESILLKIEILRDGTKDSIPLQQKQMFNSLLNETKNLRDHIKCSNTNFTIHHVID